MKKKVSPSKPLFDFLQIDVSDVDKHPTCIDDILAKRSTGLIIRGALSPRTVQVVRERIDKGLIPFLKQPFVGFSESPSAPFMLGQVLVASAPDLEEYFSTAAQTRKHLRELFEGEIDIEAFLVRVLGALSGGKPVRLPRGADGRTYAPATIRSLPEGQGIGLHADNASSRTPQMQPLATSVDVDHQLSFFFTLSAPESGGKLVVYGLEWDDVVQHYPQASRAGEILYDEASSMLPLVELSGSEIFSPGEGDLLIFDAGRYFHRVTPTIGAKNRVTLGGFMALSRDGSTLDYWS